MSDALNKLFPDVKDQVPPENIETAAPTIDFEYRSFNFLDYLPINRCEDLIISNKLKIHIGTGDIYYDNNDTNESIYGFFQLQEDKTKKIIEHEFVYDGTYQQYYGELLLKINQQDDDRLDALTNKNSKFLFCHFNNFLTRVNVTSFPVGHSKTTNDDPAIDIIQNENWQHFIEKNFRGL